jgi:mRNA-degrading endonuclease RelE of RelBE toxin-antitoxin system
MLKIKFERQAEKFLSKQLKINARLAKQITKEILILSNNPQITSSKALVGYDSYRRLRVGDDRIVYHYDERNLHIVIIGKREDIYKKFTRLT